MKKMILLICFLSGCAALRGQMKYNGKGDQPTITERIGHMPEMPKPGMASPPTGLNEKQDEDTKKQKEAMRSYWELPVDKIATVLNPLDKAIKTHIECYASFPSEFDFVVPAHTSQDMLFTTNAQYMYNTLCRIAEWEVVEETK